MDCSSASFSGLNGGPSNFLTNLPSRGLFSSTVPSSNPGGMRVYICDHDTSPPEDQLIKTNQTNILIRSLILKNQKGSAVNEGSRKRAAEKPLDGRGSVKRVVSNTQQTNSRQDFKCLTVEKLRALLKEKGLSVRGKKDELIARLNSVNC